PLLWRLLDQLLAAGFFRIVAATTPRLEPQIRDSVAGYLRTTSQEADIAVVGTPEQHRGVVFGLARLLERWPVERCLVCLGDIFFLANPFPAFRQLVESDTGFLGVGPATFAEELRLGGLVYEEDGRVLSIVERPASAVAGGPLRWSGIALFHRHPALEDVESFVADAPDDPPPGDFFEFQRRRGRDLRCVPGPDFVNVNSPDQHLLSCLYARLEAESADGALSTSLRSAAAALRLSVACRPRPEAR
ncbi:MAG TPA: hypothetical protein VJ788_09405, partial [Gemmatimonadota bacterium]|nr:hypothetical protein [Gemmatimonadota bacterium]